LRYYIFSDIFDLEEYVEWLIIYFKLGFGEIIQLRNKPIHMEGRIDEKL